MKRFFVLGALLLATSCNDDVHRSAGAKPDADAGTDGAADAERNTDTGAPAPQSGVCVLAQCPKPTSGVGQACCTPAAECGVDPFSNGIICLPNVPASTTDAGSCDLSTCPKSDTSAIACCQQNGACGLDPLGIGLCFPPPPSCDQSACDTGIEGGPHTCCQQNGQCGIDTFGVGLCFPPPTPLCELSRCPSTDGGPRACCLQNGQCGVDVSGNGLCTAPVVESCDLAQCPKNRDGVASCCLPNGECGLDSFGIGVCFANPPTGTDGGPPVVKPPDDPSITGECPNFIGTYGPVWGCCSGFGVCGTFADAQCLIPAGTPLPVPAPEAGISEAFLRCTPPKSVR